MPYSTVLSVANFSLGMCGLKPIPDATAYMTRASLDKFQYQATLFLDCVQREIGLVFNKRLFWRKFTITTTPTLQTSYPCPAGVIIEGFKANSFFNVTAGGSANGALSVINYELWRESYPNPDQVASGFPTYLVPVPDDGTETPRVILFPYPSQVFTIEGQCRLMVGPVTSGSQLCVFPQHYEHMMIYALRELLEESRMEGRAPSAAARAQKVVEEVLRDATKASEEEYPIDPGIRLWNNFRESRRDYNPSTDVVPPYTG